MRNKFYLDIDNFIHENISLFHEQRLEYIRSNINFKNILERKNPYLFKAKNCDTAQDIVKGFIDAFLQSQEETIFGDFLERLAIFVANKKYDAKKSDLVGIDLEFETDEKYYIIEIKAGWNWANSSQIKQLKINFENAKKIIKNKTKKEVVAVNGCCYGKIKNRQPEKDGYYKLCGQEFWCLISGEENFYIKIITPIGYKAKQRNTEFLEAYSILINKFTLEFSLQYCKDGIIDWDALLKFNSGKK